MGQQEIKRKLKTACSFVCSAQAAPSPPHFRFSFVPSIGAMNGCIVVILFNGVDLLAIEDLFFGQLLQ